MIPDALTGQYGWEYFSFEEYMPLDHCSPLGFDGDGWGDGLWPDYSPEEDEGDANF